MRRPLVLTLLLSAAPAMGCNALYHFDEYTTDGTAEGDGGPGASEDGGKGGEASATVDTGAAQEAAVAPECVKNADCTGKGSVFTIDASAPDADAGNVTVTSPAVCVKATGKCAPLLTPECPRAHGDFMNDDAVFMGTMLTSNDPNDTGELERAAVLAAEELSSDIAGGGLPSPAAHGKARPLAFVSCDPGPGLLAGASHLSDILHVAAVVGPREAEDVVNATQHVTSKGQTLVITPTSVVSSLSNLVDDDLTWRDVASDDQRAKLVIEQMNEIENVLHSTRGPTVKLGIMNRTDAQGTSARDAIAGKLIINGHFISDPANAAFVTMDTYEVKGSDAALATIEGKYARAVPDIVFVTAPEQIAGVVVPLEQALTAARAVTKPYYVCTDAVKASSFLAAIGTTGVGADIKRRVRGVGVKSDTASTAVFDAFSGAYTARFGGEAPSPAAAMTYDAVYAVAYAIAATPDLALSGKSVARGLRSLGVGDTYPVGAAQAHAVMQNLAAGKSVSLRGTFSLMQWDTSGDIQGGTVEVWCIGAPGGAPAFGSSGLTMDIQTQVIGGAFVQCQ